ncbi:MAG: family 20 glycosylhydrolase [Cytophagales bacterium]|nr:family 20 glycosylhydrolase [Bernardetiaceae bacterium]MDW8205857.1 family 20 glycosylhydrolase [Cytophagales bacterium]
MKRFIIAYLLTSGMVATLIAQSVKDMPALIPRPVNMQLKEGIFKLTPNVKITYNDEAALQISTLLMERLQKATGWQLKAQKSVGGSGIILQINRIPDDKIGNEGYYLKVSPSAVQISANQPAGLFYGIQTLLQLLPTAIESNTPTYANWYIPAVEITDYPRFTWRGIMLDVSRHFFTKEEVKRYIDQIARLKFNTLHWHLTDDNGWRIEIKSLPKLTEIGAWRVERHGYFNMRKDPQPGEPATYGGYYTHEDIREIVAYAQARYVTIVPEIDVPGHSMAALAAYPELSCTQQKVYVNPGTAFSEWYGNGTFKMLVDNTLNPADEKVYEFLDKVFTEVAMLFPGEYIHAGGDECYKGYWANDARCQALMKQLKTRHVEDLQGYFMSRVEKIIRSKGKKMIGWDEILEGGVSTEVAIMSWRGMKGGIEAAREGHRVVMSPTTYAYLDYQQGEASIEPPVYAALRAKKVYSFEPVPPDTDPQYIMGVQGNVWTEQIPHFRQLEYMTYPRAWALAEVAWSPREGKNWHHFATRMEKHFARASVAGINYAKSVYDAIVQTEQKNNKLTVLMATEIPDLHIYYTIDGSMPDNHSPRYGKPFELPEGPITLRVITYRGNQPIGRLITLPLSELEKRAGKDDRSLLD